LKELVRDTVAISVKELRQLKRDPVSLILTIMFPILLISIFIVISQAFSATSYNIPVVVADLDGTPASALLLDKLTSSPLIRVTQLVQTEDQAYNAVSSGQAFGAAIIPKGFGDDLIHGQAFVIVETDNSRITSSTIIIASMNRASQELLNEALLGESSLQLKASPVEIITRPVSGRPPSGDTILPGFLGMIAILGAFDDIVNAISRERERGTFPRLILSPISIFSIYSGKMFSTVLLTILRTALMLVIFRLQGLVIRGNILLIFLTTCLIAIFTLSVGLTLSSRVKGSSTLTILEIAMTFPLFTLAGTTNSPQTLASEGRAIAYSLPWTYGNEALRRVIYLGLGFDAIAGDLFILLLGSLVLMPIAIMLSKRTM
jgi:ABC-2 type transport system permease protein